LKVVRFTRTIVWIAIMTDVFSNTAIADGICLRMLWNC